MFVDSFSIIVTNSLAIGISNLRSLTLVLYLSAIRIKLRLSCDFHLVFVMSQRSKKFEECL